MLLPVILGMEGPPGAERLRLGWGRFQSLEGPGAHVLQISPWQAAKLRELLTDRPPEAGLKELRPGGEPENVMADAPRLAAGDVVRLRSGSPDMAVQSFQKISGEEWAVTAWFGGDEQRSGTFRIESLVPTRS